MSKRFRWLTTFVAGVFLAACLVPNAQADEVWGRNVRCGLDWTANMHTTTMGVTSISHYYDDVHRRTVSGVKSLSTSKPRMSGTVYVHATVKGVFRYHTAGCYCPPNSGACGS